MNPQKKPKECICGWELGSSKCRDCHSKDGEMAGIKPKEKPASGADNEFEMCACGFRQSKNNPHRHNFENGADATPAEGAEAKLPITQIEMALPLTQENVRKVVEYAEKMEGTEAKGDSPMKGADYSQSTKEGCATSSPANPAPSSVLTSLEKHHLILGMGEDGFFDKSRNRLEAVQEKISRTEQAVLAKCRAEMDALRKENALFNATVKSAPQDIIPRFRDLVKENWEKDARIQELEQERERILSTETVQKIVRAFWDSQESGDERPSTLLIKVHEILKGE
jgi:uncharacterized protein YdcH (DUF465 family)